MYHPIVTVRCPRGLLARLEAVASARGLNRSQAMRLAIEEFCDAEDEKEREGSSGSEAPGGPEAAGGAASEDAATSH